MAIKNMYGTVGRDGQSWSHPERLEGLLPVFDQRRKLLPMALE